MRAVVITKRGVAAVQDIPEQSMRPGYIKIKTVAAGLNPTDRDHVTLDGVGRIGGILGCDISGTVVDIGPDCKSDVKVGDAVYGACHGANLWGPEDGAYAEYALIRDGRINKIPEGMSFEEVATLGVSLTTIGQTLYMTFGLPLPGEVWNAESPQQILLVTGGSTATGTLAVQFAKLSGLKVIATASPSNFALVKDRGADEVFDYHDPKCGQLIRAYTNNSITHVLDCVSTDSSFQTIVSALPETTANDQEIRILTLLPADKLKAMLSTQNVKVKFGTTLAYTTFGEAFDKFGMQFPPLPQIYEHDTRFWKLAGELLVEGKWKPHPIEIRGGGLEGIPEGIKQFGTNPPSGIKLIYRTMDEADGQASSGSVEQPTVEHRSLGSDWAQRELTDAQ